MKLVSIKHSGVGVLNSISDFNINPYEAGRFWLLYSKVNSVVVTSSCFPRTDTILHTIGIQFLSHTGSNTALLKAMRNRNTVYIGHANNEFIVITDFFGQQPVYLYESNSFILVFTHFDDFFINFPDIQLSLDHTAIWENFIFDSSLCTRTIFNEISMLSPGTITTYSTLDLTTHSFRYYNYIFPLQRPSSIEEAAKNIFDLLHNSISKLSASSFLIPLSGGIDSRLLVSIFEDVWGADKLNTISFAANLRSFEIQYAKQVSSALNIDSWSSHILTSDSYIQSLDIIPQRFGGNLSISHGHLNTVLQNGKSMFSPESILISGAFADAVSGYAVHGPPKVHSLELSQPVRRLKSLNRALDLNYIYDAIYKDIWSIYSDFTAGSNINTFDEYFYITQRQHRIQFLQSALYSDTLPVINPYANPDIAEFLMGLPYEMRMDKSITRATLLLIGKNIHSIPDISSSKNRATVSKKFNLFRRKIVNNLSRSITLLLRDKHLFFSPYETESQDYNLRSSHRLLAISSLIEMHNLEILNQNQYKILSQKPIKQYGGWFLPCTQYWSITIHQILKTRAKNINLSNKNSDT